jgi:hypothetical protein
VEACRPWDASTRPVLGAMNACWTACTKRTLGRGRLSVENRAEGGHRHTARRLVSNAYRCLDFRVYALGHCVRKIHTSPRIPLRMRFVTARLKRRIYSSKGPCHVHNASPVSVEAISYPGPLGCLTHRSDAEPSGEWIRPVEHSK